VIAQLRTSFRLSLAEQQHNRFAIALLLGYLPAWYAIIAALSAGSIQFKLRAFNVIVLASQAHLSLLTGMLNATTLIMGFVGLTVTRQSEAVDQRLVLCGHSRTALIMGRLVALALAALAVALYAAGVLSLFFSVRHFLVVAAGTFVAVAAYVAIGMLAGVILPGELEGLFFIIMLSLVDTFMQNPIGSAAANQGVVRFFPTYLPMQMVAAGALTNLTAWWQFWAGLGWTAGVGALGMAAFWYRTRTAGAAE
jgi:ABC-2 type transport system permease protein